MVAGEIATTPDAAIALADAGRSVILVRSETSPDDVHGIARAAGLLTSTGGLASHAAVVARGWGIPAVVGATGVVVSDDAVSIDGRLFALGSPITIDGSTGEVFDGVVVGSVATVPEAAKLLGWARELGIPIGDVASGEAEDAPPAEVVVSAAPEGDAEHPSDTPGHLTRDDVLGVLAIKGYGTPASLTEALLGAPEALRPILDGLFDEGLVEVAAGDSLRLTAKGKDVANRGFGADRDRWGTDQAAVALEAFRLLDARVKETVTAWQMRERDGSQVLNDHTDPAYDAGVLQRLGALQMEVLAWLDAIDAPVERFRTYRARLDRAARLATGGDPRYIASPRVDSYHGTWFELHEDLIVLSGRTRAEEVAAGRA
jgi:pyruvate,orthophosphate dikinase